MWTSEDNATAHFFPEKKSQKITQNAINIFSYKTYFVHLDMSKNPETGIEGFRFRTKAGFFLLL